MSKTERSSSAVRDRLVLAPPFFAARSVPLEVNGGVEVIEMSCEAGERMCSTWVGEDMGVEDKRRWDAFRTFIISGLRTNIGNWTFVPVHWQVRSEPWFGT